MDAVINKTNELVFIDPAFFAEYAPQYTSEKWKALEPGETRPLGRHLENPKHDFPDDFKTMIKESLRVPNTQYAKKTRIGLNRFDSIEIDKTVYVPAPQPRMSISDSKSHLEQLFGKLTESSDSDENQGFVGYQWECNIIGHKMKLSYYKYVSPPSGHPVPEQKYNFLHRIETLFKQHCIRLDFYNDAVFYGSGTLLMEGSLLPMLQDFLTRNNRHVVTLHIETQSGFQIDIYMNNAMTKADFTLYGLIAAFKALFNNLSPANVWERTTGELKAPMEYILKTNNIIDHEGKWLGKQSS